LRNGQASYGDTSYEVSFEEVEGVFGCPLEDGEEILNSKHELFGGWLVFELSQRVIWEESLLQGEL